MQISRKEIIQTIKALDEIMQFVSDQIVYGYGDQEYDQTYRAKKTLQKLLQDTHEDPVHGF